MLTIQAKPREILGKKTKALRQQGILPAVLYGPKIKTAPIEVDYKKFEEIYENAGESSLIKLEVKETNKTEDYLVLIYDIVKHPLSSKFVHVDFYQPDLEKEVEAHVPIILEGEARVIKDLGGTLVQNISELLVSALPQDLPKEIKVNVERLKTLEDVILVGNIRLPEGVRPKRDEKEVIVSVSALEKVEEELKKPIEEKVEEVEKVEEKQKESKEEKEKIGRIDEKQETPEKPKVSDKI